jgi:hypothetical protein
MKEVVARILQSDLGPTAKLVAIAEVCGVRVHAIGLSNRSIERHLADAQELVRSIRSEVQEAPVTRPREKADPDAWLRFQEQDLMVSKAGVKPLHRS